MAVDPLTQVQQAVAGGSLPAAFYFHGPEDLLKDEAVRAVTDGVLDPSLRDFNLDLRSASELDAEEIPQLCYALPMMADRRVVVVRDVEAWKKRTRGRAAMAAYLAKPSPETVVLLVQGGGDPEPDAELARHARSLRFDELDADEAVRWATRQAERAGVAVEPGTLEHLVRAVGTELGILRAELAKLEAFTGGPAVTRDQLADLVGIRHGETADDWRDAVLANDTPRALALVDPLLGQSGVTGVRLVSLLGTALVALGAVRPAFDAGRKGRTLENEVWEVLKRSRPAGIGPWKEFVLLLSKATPKWPQARIARAVRATLETDMALKSTTVTDAGGLLRQLVLRVAVEA